MEICADNHVEIVHDESFCPLCEVYEEKHDLNKLNDEYEEKISNLENKIEELENIAR